MLRIDKLSLRYGEHILFKDAQFSIEQKERVCIIGRNGAGKSTLLKIINNTITADETEYHLLSGTRISTLNQELPSETDILIEDYLLLGLNDQQQRIVSYQKSSTQLNSSLQQKQLEKLQAEIEANGGWDLQKKIDSSMTAFQLPNNQRLSELSGGWQKRAALAKALISDPHLLLLDEPTNHLDLMAIDWLEKRLLNYKGSIIFITHDRQFLKKIATRIVEIDRTAILNWPGSYENYLKLKMQSNIAEDTQNTLFDKRLQQEEAWIRQGIKARRTRNEGRVRSLQEMRKEASQRIKRHADFRIQIETAEASGRKIIDAHRIHYRINDKNILHDFSLKIMRGERIGLIGNNGVGKSTLLKLLFSNLKPDKGTIKVGTNLEIAYFDQNRNLLDLNKTIAYNVGNGSDYIQINGNQRHVIGYLKGFLFSPDRSLTKVRLLSGGEKNRVLLAKLFVRPSNLLILDEPTNDLDIEMLEILEKNLMSYQGTLIVVSHDREFLDNIVTSTLVFESSNTVQRYPGGYSDWLRKGRQLQRIEKSLEGSKSSKPTSKILPKKLSYKVQRELDEMPNLIETNEKQLDSLQQELSDNKFYELPYTQQQQTLDKITEIQQQLDYLNNRWVELEEMH